MSQKEISTITFVKPYTKHVRALTVLPLCLDAVNSPQLSNGQDQAVYMMQAEGQQQRHAAQLVCRSSLNHRVWVCEVLHDTAGSRSTKSSSALDVSSCTRSRPGLLSFSPS